MLRIIGALALASLAGCATNTYAGNQICARTAGCVSSFANDGLGPIQAQAVAPQSAGALQPQR